MEASMAFRVLGQRKSDLGPSAGACCAQQAGNVFPHVLAEYSIAQGQMAASSSCPCVIASRK